MRIDSIAAVPLLIFALCLAPRDAVAQPQVGATELARAKVLLDLSRAELTAEQFALLSRRLAAAENAFVEFTTVVRASQASAIAAEGGAAAAGARATATGGRALLSGAADLLPFLLLVWPATAHAPGVKEETPAVRAAKSKVEESLKALAEAARQVDSEKMAAQSRRSAEPESERKCPPCAGQLPSPRIDSDHTHHPCPGEHVHYFVWEQNPKTCQCFAKDRLACL